MYFGYRQAYLELISTLFSRRNRTTH